ncbi:hypothetical protein AYI70_g2897 [Smittium culicis]|uniref:Uncharacterized protein n=1 Tax=Smittium culicis TaxID=133412 RepID=A0A1R1Y649_9FUNG|nr:hypothetical protein AYI70_g2897 [Smittium culicis]
MFVSNHTSTPEILSRPWYTRSRVLKVNILDGPFWYTVRGEKSGAAAMFYGNDGYDVKRYKTASVTEKRADTCILIVIKSFYGAFYWVNRIFRQICD